ncbi:GGDEF domain-containing protein [Colwellia piezophila]|uniref:GGDEF domain-containing protein n=1 Tax=Colwellia piezophila TaxID=211668 RepID=UPI000374303A|nr:GGDEF domain-containing protein [Colwellia piezophila]
MTNRTTSEKVLLSLSLLATITISPFAFLRWFDGETTLAIIDAIISLTAFMFFLFIFITRKISAANTLLAIFLAFAVLVTVFIKGEPQILWLAPTIIAIHYLMPLNLARITSVTLALAILMIIYPRVDLTYLFTFIATTGLTASLSFVIFRSYTDKQNELSLLALIDSLTSSGNRRALDLKLAEVIASQHREEYSMCLILVDLDYFKEVNDDHGHAVGDQILVRICELITKHTRVLDSLYRYGGDEFIIMPLNMNIKTAKILAEKIRSIIELHEFTNNIKLTLSIGVAEYKAHDTPESWISRADTALYKAKESGRNMIC